MHDCVCCVGIADEDIVTGMSQSDPLNPASQTQVYDPKASVQFPLMHGLVEHMSGCVLLMIVACVVEKAC